MQKSTLMKLIAALKNEDSIEAHLSASLDIETDILALKRKIQEEGQKYQETVTKLHKAIKEVQTRCSHPIHTFYGDPAGGSDSCNLCDVCSYEW